jgi:hypothetical protein
MVYQDLPFAIDTNIIKCPYTINKNYKQNMKRDAETFAQCRSRVLCRYHI